MQTHWRMVCRIIRGLLATCTGIVLDEHARQLHFVPVRKVGPTLISTSAKIYLSMAGAKQHNDTGFILVPAVGRTSSRGALEALYCVAPLCLQRGAASVAGEEEGPPGP
jgi:hypothetical protein